MTCCTLQSTSMKLHWRRIFGARLLNQFRAVKEILLAGDTNRCLAGKFAARAFSRRVGRMKAKEWQLSATELLSSSAPLPTSQRAQPRYDDDGMMVIKDPITIVVIAIISNITIVIVTTATIIIIIITVVVTTTTTTPSNNNNNTTIISFATLSRITAYIS